MWTRSDLAAPRVEAAAPILVDRLEVRLVSPEGDVVRYTTDGSEPNVDSTRYAGELVLESSTRLRAATFRGARRSRVLEACFERVAPHPSTAVRPDESGLEVELWLGAWIRLPSLADTRPSATWIAPDLEPPDRDWVRSMEEPDLALRARGWVRAPQRAVYAFECRFDDALRLVVSNVTLLDEDGRAPRRTREAFVALEAGWHALYLESMQAVEDALPDLAWGPAGEPRSPVIVFHERP